MATIILHPHDLKDPRKKPTADNIKQEAADTIIFKRGHETEVLYSVHDEDV